MTYCFNVEFEKLLEPIKFPCLFVPIEFTTQEGEYNWDKAEIVECKIRGAGHYFKIKAIQKQVATNCGYVETI